MTIAERMFSIMAEKGKRPAQLCAILGVGTSQTTSWKNRNADPPAKYIMQIANFLEVTPEYLLSGVDTAGGRLSPIESEMLAMFRRLPKEMQYEFKGELKGYLAATQPTVQDEAI